MLDLIVVQHHHHQGDRHAVIRAERCSVCGEHAVLQHQVDALFLKIMLYTCTFVADHINVSLQHDRSLVLRTFAAFFFDDDIIAVILVYPQTSVFCKFYKEIADPLLVS